MNHLLRPSHTSSDLAHLFHNTSEVQINKDQKFQEIHKYSNPYEILEVKLSSHIQNISIKKEKKLNIFCLPQRLQVESLSPLIRVEVFQCLSCSCAMRDRVSGDELIHSNNSQEIQAQTKLLMV